MRTPPKNRVLRTPKHWMNCIRMLKTKRSPDGINILTGETHPPHDLFHSTPPPPTGNPGALLHGGIDSAPSGPSPCEKNLRDIFVLVCSSLDLLAPMGEMSVIS